MATAARLSGGFESYDARRAKCTWPNSCIGGCVEAKTQVPANDRTPVKLFTTCEKADATPQYFPIGWSINLIMFPLSGLDIGHRDASPRSSKSLVNRSSQA